MAIKQLQESDLPEAARICRLAFATFLKQPPETFRLDEDYVGPRFRTDPGSAFTAHLGDRLAGSNFAIAWGSVGFFGPLTIHPEFWNRGLAKPLIATAIERLENLGVRHIGLFTFAESPKHLGLYQSFGFWPRFMTAILSAPVAVTTPEPHTLQFSTLAASNRNTVLSDARHLTGELYDGLDLSHEITSASAQNRGETIFMYQGSRLSGMAVLDVGPGTPAGTAASLIRFAAIRPGPDAAHDFAQLISACHALARNLGAERLIASVNTRCHAAYRGLLGLGFRTDRQGILMHRPNAECYHREDAYILDNWR